MQFTPKRPVDLVSERRRLSASCTHMAGDGQNPRERHKRISRHFVGCSFNSTLTEFYLARRLRWLMYQAKNDRKNLGIERLPVQPGSLHAARAV